MGIKTIARTVAPSKDISDQRSNLEFAVHLSHVSQLILKFLKFFLFCSLGLLRSLWGLVLMLLGETSCSVKNACLAVVVLKNLEIDAIHLYL